MIIIKFFLQKAVEMANFERTNENDNISGPILKLFVCAFFFCLLHILDYKTQDNQCYGKKDLISLTHGILTETRMKRYDSLELRNIRTPVNKFPVLQQIPTDKLIGIISFKIYCKKKRGRRGENSRKLLCNQINKKSLISVLVKAFLGLWEIITI